MAMWPVAIACLLLSKSNQNLSVLIVVFVISNTAMIFASGLVKGFFDGELQRFQIERFQSSLTGFYLRQFERIFHAIVVALVAYRWADLKLFWVTMLGLYVCTLVFLFLGYLSLRAHPEAYSQTKPEPNSVARRFRPWAIVVSVVHVSVWCYAWREWFFV